MIGRLVPVLVAVTSVTSACMSGSDQRIPLPEEGVAERPTSEPSSSSDPPISTSGRRTSLVVDLDADGRPIDQRVLGTNVPAWLGPDLLADPDFQEMTIAAGTSLLRFPGGSWSNTYDWLGCELADEQTCFFPGSARPSDFLALMRETDLPAMWTVSMNATAEEAAALVAFFNGDPDDPRPIGLDDEGRDWATVGFWAQIRVNRGFEQPADIELWEIGNEVFAGRPDVAGSTCAAFGWEDVWTCDGSEYVVGTEGHDGFLEIRGAMVAVDPSIQVGAVGIPDEESWGGWGRSVLDLAGRELDFYVIHHYPFTGEVDADDLVDRARTDWGLITNEVDALAASVGLDAAPPIAVTEYNVSANQDDDDDAVMSSQAGALYVAVTIGEMAENGIGIANQWNLANGRAGNGSDYGLIDPATGDRNPSYYAFALWSRFGEELLEVDVDRVGDSGIAAAYAGRRPDGRATLLLVNDSDQGELVDVVVGQRAEAQVDSASAPSLSSANVAFNENRDPSLNLTEPARSLGLVDDRFEFEVPAASIVLFTFESVDESS